MAPRDLWLCDSLLEGRQTHGRDSVEKRYALHLDQMGYSYSSDCVDCTGF
jgi:hypothetical protein